MNIEKFYEDITMKAVADTVAKLLGYPFGFHGDTGIRDYLYARLHIYGAERLDFNDPKPGYSTLLLQSEQYTRFNYKNTGMKGQEARFDISLTLPPRSTDTIKNSFAENLTAVFAFELGKNKPLIKVIDPGMLEHKIDTIPATSDISKLYLELMHYDLKQGWAIEFYNQRARSVVAIISKTFDICKRIHLREGKKLVVIFVGFSLDGKHYVSSNDENVQLSLIKRLHDTGIDASSDLSLLKKRDGLLNQEKGWGSFGEPSASVEEVFGKRAQFANRIIKIGEMKESGKKSQYVNLSSVGKKTIAQIHPHKNGIALVLRSRNEDRPKTSFTEIKVVSLIGYKGTNAKLLNGVGDMFEKKGPAIAFFIPDEVYKLDDNAREWQEIINLLAHAKTLS